MDDILIINSTINNHELKYNLAKDEIYMVDNRSKKWEVKKHWFDKSCGYDKINIGDKDYKLHRVIYKIYNPNWDIDFEPHKNQIDHKDRNKTNNKIYNLKLATHQQNQFNKDVKGCTFIKETGKWRSRIYRDKTPIHLGYFDTEKEAHEAYLKAKPIYHCDEEIEVESIKPKKIYKGCYYDKKSKKWRAEIIKNKVRKHLGYFNTEKEAHEAYLREKES